MHVLADLEIDASPIKSGMQVALTLASHPQLLENRKQLFPFPNCLMLESA
jgi:hypothetical protein